MDPIDIRLLELLSEDARLPLKELAAEVGMSPPAVAERVRRLRERGVIRRFTVEIDPRAVGYPLEAIVRVRHLPGRMPVVEKLLRELPAIIECDKVTGDDCFIARMLVRSMEEIDAIMEGIADNATTSTAMVKGRPVPRRAPRLRPDGS